MTESSAGEFKLIERLAALLPRPSARVEVGIGDDAAVLKSPRGRSLLCSDLMVEGVHFDLSFATAEDVGFKALAAALSDIAAMNGRPLAAVVSLALPKSRASDFIDGFYRGAREIAALTACDVVGGDLSSSPDRIFVDVACFGETLQPILRSGAAPGDLVAVSGHPGSSAAGLHALKSNVHVDDPLRSAHLRPKPRFDLLSAPDFAVTCSSLIDVSDGLSSELAHLAKASRVGFEIEAAKIPLHAATIRLAGETRALAWALHGGEDYELLATFAPGAKIPPGFTVIGRVTSDGLTLVQHDGSRI
ncbi:MAG: thiamine-phosphate kinase, partial [Bdellovibrionota bacterium]